MRGFARILGKGEQKIESSKNAAGRGAAVSPSNRHRRADPAFPDLVRQFARSGAEMLVNLSNDGYFGRSAAREQHLEIVRMRAAENRRWILRSTNDGVTAMIDSSGRVTQRLQPYRELASPMQFRYTAPLTPYTRYGDWFAWASLIAGLALAGVGARSGEPKLIQT